MTLSSCNKFNLKLQIGCDAHWRLKNHRGGVHISRRRRFDSNPAFNKNSSAGSFTLSLVLLVHIQSCHVYLLNAFSAVARMLARFLSATAQWVYNVRGAFSCRLDSLRVPPKSFFSHLMRAIRARVCMRPAAFDALYTSKCIIYAKAKVCCASNENSMHSSARR